VTLPGTRDAQNTKKGKTQNKSKTLPQNSKLLEAHFIQKKSYVLNFFSKT
jgi:hypothetical protein